MMTNESSGPRVAFGDVVKQVKDRVDPKTSGLTRYIAGEHMDTDNLRIRRWGEITDDYLGPAFHMRFKPGQVLYGSRRTYLRKVAVPDFEGICANTTFVLESKNPDVLLPELLPFIMQTESFNEHSVKQSKGSVNPYVNFSDLAWYEFALPSLAEQRRIAEVLRAIEDSSEAIVVAESELNNCRSSYLESVFGREYGATKRIDEIADIVSGGTPARRRSDYWNGTIPWLSPKDMKQTLLEDTTEHITQLAVKDGARLAPSGSIFVVVRGMILAHTFPVCRSSSEMAFNQDVRAITPNNGIVPAFLHAWFEWAAPRYLQLVSESSHGTKRLETSQLLRLQVPTLRISVQESIVDLLDRFCFALDGLSERRESNTVLKNRILAELQMLP